jgi:hypothetical protein
MLAYTSQDNKSQESHDFSGTWTRVMLKCKGSEDSKEKNKDVVIQEDQDADLGHETTSLYT